MGTRRKLRAVTAGVAAVSLAATAACSNNTGHGPGGTAQASALKVTVATDPASSRGPAAPVPGAVRGGNLVTIQEKDFTHLDPQLVYTPTAQALDQMIGRTLTTYATDPKTGATRLVGDLATNVGTDVNHDGRTWKYTLKDGLRYEDGSPITAADVAYGVARSFSPDLSDGPHYIQQWLAGSTNYNATYQGPYNGGAAVPPGVTVPDGKTIIFHFPQPQPDLPFAAALGTSTPLPRARDPRPQTLDARPFASGPYKVQTYQKDNQLVLTRNQYWDPRTDAVRHDYPDQITVQFGPDDKAQTNRLIADVGPDRNAISMDGVPTSLASKVLGDKSLKSRYLAQYTAYVYYLSINTRRVRDLKVRQAINYAMDKAGYLQVVGGSSAGEVASTIESPTVAGYRSYSAYPSKGDHGDVAKARKLLGGRHPELVYAFSNTQSGQSYATVVQQSLQRAGFKVTLRPLDGDSYYSLIGRSDNPYDFYLNSWSADWPSGLTAIPPQFDGTTIAPAGNKNASFLNVPEINDRIHRIQREDTARAAADWAALDEEIMTRYAPVVPLYDTRVLLMMGSKVRGVTVSTVLSNPIYDNAYLAR